MAANNLGSLAAANVLQVVCEYLDKTDLINFALANQFCASIANLCLFREVSISVLSGQQLKLDIDIWISRLERRSSFGFVRRLELLGCMTNNELEASYISEQIRQAKKDRSTDDVEINGGLRCVKDRTPWFPTVGGGSQGQRHGNEEDWKPLDHFIRRLPVLNDLIFACNDRFPPFLLSLLQQYKPNCRLHLENFRLYSLANKQTDPYEYELVKSPALHSISVYYATWNSDGTQDFHEEFRPGNSPHVIEAWKNGILRPWHGFSQDTRIQSLLPIKLQSFESKVYTSQKFIEKWTNCVDFSNLRILKLRGTVTAATLGWAAANCNFRSLKKLCPDMIYEGSLKNRDEKIEEYQTSSNWFLRSLPPLEDVAIYGHLQQGTLDVILGHSSKSLCNLEIGVSRGYKGLVFNAGEVHKIQQNCPMLEKVSLGPVPRSKGDKQEASIYKSLGGVPKLQEITLTLDSGNWKILSGYEDTDSEDGNFEVLSDPSFDEFHSQFAEDSWHALHPRKGHIRDALINSALDEDLARAVFSCISQNKGPNSLPLENLKLISVGGGEFGGYTNYRQGYVGLVGLTETLKSLGRSWLLTRGIRDDSRDKINVQEIGEWRGTDSTNSAWPLIKDTFRKIWPGENDGESDWTKDWHSWPLDTES